MAVLLNGSSSKASYTGSVVTTYPVSMFCWAKLNATGMAQNDVIMGIGKNGAGQPFMRATHVSAGHQIYGHAYDGSASALAASTSAAVQDTWMPLLVVYASASSRAIYFRSGAVVSNADVSSPNISSFDRVVLGSEPQQDGIWLGGEVAEFAIWNATLNQANFDALAGGALPETVVSGSLIELWKLETATDLTGVNGRTLTGTALANGGTHPVTRAAATAASFAITTADATFSGGGMVRPIASFAVTAENTTFAGGAGPLISASFSVTTTNTIFAGGATGDVSAGTITCPALKNNTGTVLANEAGITAFVYAVATGALVATKTAQTTNESGVLAFTSAGIVPGTTYRVVIVLGSGAEGMDKVAAT